MRTIWACMLVASLALSGLSQPPSGKPAPSPAPKPASAAAQPAAAPREITLEFKNEGERWWWAEKADGTPLNIPQKVSEKKATIKLPEGTAVLWVLESKTGNMAQFKADELKETLTIRSDDWTHVARLQVNVRAQERPVAMAVVSLKDEAGHQRVQVLEPTAEGILLFERVPLGKVVVEVRYGDDQKVTQEMRLKAERDEHVPVLNIALSGEVETVAPPKASAQKQAPTGSRIGAIVMFLLALALAIGVLVLLVRLALQKEKPLAEAMQKLGVELPAADSGGGTTAPVGPPRSHRRNPTCPRWSRRELRPLRPPPFRQVPRRRASSVCRVPTPGRCSTSAQNSSPSGARWATPSCWIRKPPSAAAMPNSRAKMVSWSCRIWAARTALSLTGNASARPPLCV
jgi:hypothetical protein